MDNEYIRELAIAENIDIKIPKNLLEDYQGDILRIAIFCFLYINTNRRYKINVSLGELLKWMHHKSDNHKGAINEKIICCIKYLVDNDYFCYDSYYDESDLMNTKLQGRIKLACNPTNSIYQNNYILVFWDEVKSIMECRNHDKGYSYRTDNHITLLLFVYLRMKIFRRGLKVPVEFKDLHDYELKRSEVYYSYYKDIAETLLLRERNIFLYVDILDTQLHLIKHEVLYRSKIDEKFLTHFTIFTNYYKRQNGKLVSKGGDYYNTEIENFIDYYNSTHLNSGYKLIVKSE